MADSPSTPSKGVQSPKTTPAQDRARQLREKTHECETLKAQVQETELKLERATDARRRVEKRARTIHQTDRGDLQTEHATVLKKFRQYKKTMKQLKTELEGRDSLLSEKTSELDATELQLEDVQARVSKIRNHLKRVSRESDENVRQLNEMQEIAEQERTRTKELMSRTAEAEERARSESSRESALRNEIRKLKLETKQLEDDIERMNRKSEVDEFMKGEFVSFMRVTKIAFHERAELKADLDAALAENRRLREQLKDETVRMQSLEGKKRDLEGHLGQFDSLKAEFSQCKLECESAEGRVRKVLAVCLAEPRVELKK